MPGKLTHEAQVFLRKPKFMTVFINVAKAKRVSSRNKARRINLKLGPELNNADTMNADLFPINKYYTKITKSDRLK